MPSHSGTWARRTAFAINLNKSGVEADHFVCAGYYSCTESGSGEIVRPRQHVWVAITFEYEQGVQSDRRATAYEPLLVTHIESTADGLGIMLLGKAMLNWPRLSRSTVARTRCHAP